MKTPDLFVRPLEKAGEDFPSEYGITAHTLPGRKFWFARLGSYPKHGVRIPAWNVGDLLFTAFHAGRSVRVAVPQKDGRFLTAHPVAAETDGRKRNLYTGIRASADEFFSRFPETPKTLDDIITRTLYEVELPLVEPVALILGGVFSGRTQFPSSQIASLLDDAERNGIPYEPFSEPDPGAEFETRDEAVADLKTRLCGSPWHSAIVLAAAEAVAEKHPDGLPIQHCAGYLSPTIIPSPAPTDCGKIFTVDHPLYLHPDIVIDALSEVRM